MEFQVGETLKTDMLLQRRCRFDKGGFCTLKQGALTQKDH